MNGYFPSAWQKALDIARSAQIHSHVVGDVYLYSTMIRDFYIVAGLQADEKELAQSVMAQASIARTIASCVSGGMQ